MESQMSCVFNVNVGLIGHVDSGKTTLARALSTVASTAAFDKHPQSLQRGITIDLGFSCFTMEIPADRQQNQLLVGKSVFQFTLVDCPGHASLLKTLIGGSKIIDLAFCVVDVNHGIQTQTAECMLLANLLEIPLIVVLTKLDLLPSISKGGAAGETIIRKLSDRIQKTLVSIESPKEKQHQRPSRSLVTAVDYHADGINPHSVESLKRTLVEFFEPRPRSSNPSKFVFCVDHCFNVKGHGTVLTGTVVDGAVSTKSTVHVPATGHKLKVKSIQVFRRSVEGVQQGDRAGICLPNFDAGSMERGIICTPGIVTKATIQYLFGSTKIQENNSQDPKFSPEEHYECMSQLDNGGVCFALLQLQTPVLYCEGGKLIGFRLDQNPSKRACRIAFSGDVTAVFGVASDNKQSKENKHALPFKAVKTKAKHGHVERLISNNDENTMTAIVKGMFKKESLVDRFIGLPVQFSTGDVGMIDSPFGKSGKVKVAVNSSPSAHLLRRAGGKRDDQDMGPITVTLTFKFFLHDKSKLMSVSP